MLVGHGQDGRLHLLGVVVAAGDLLEVVSFTDALGTAAVVPEPSTFILLGSGLLGLIGYKRRNAA